MQTNQKYLELGDYIFYVFILGNYWYMQIWHETEFRTAAMQKVMSA